jgi:hypothetical protein
MFITALFQANQQMMTKEKLKALHLFTIQTDVKELMTLTLSALNMLTVRRVITADGRMVRFSGKNVALPALNMNNQPC